MRALLGLPGPVRLALAVVRGTVPHTAPSTAPSTTAAAAERCDVCHRVVPLAVLVLNVGSVLLPADPAARLSWALAALAGLVGAAAFTHTAGYLVTFMTANTERGVLYFFQGSPGLALSSLALIAAFLVGVVVASTCRRRFWTEHAHGPTVLTTVALAIAGVLDLALRGWAGGRATRWTSCPSSSCRSPWARSTPPSSGTARCRCR